MTGCAEEKKFNFPVPSVFPLESKEVMDTWGKNKTWHFLTADKILVFTIITFSCWAMIYRSHRYIAVSVARL